LIVAAVLLLFYKGEYKRMKHEKMEELEDHDDNEKQSFIGTGAVKNTRYEPPANPMIFSPGHASTLPDDSNMVRVTDNSIQETSVTEGSTNNNSMNAWNSKSMSGSRGTSAQKNKKVKKDSRIKDVLVRTLSEKYLPTC
jgi:hypothetical protein